MPCGSYKNEERITHATLPPINSASSLEPKRVKRKVGGAAMMNVTMWYNYLTNRSSEGALHNAQRVSTCLVASTRSCQPLTSKRTMTAVITRCTTTHDTSDMGMTYCATPATAARVARKCMSSKRLWTDLTGQQESDQRVFVKRRTRWIGAR